MTPETSPMLGPPITHAILEEYGTRQMDPEMGELMTGLQHLGVRVEFAPSMITSKAATNDRPKTGHHEVTETGSV
jgi:hypothetical protein